MRRLRSGWVMLSLVLAGATGCGEPLPERQLLDDAVEEIGGASRLGSAQLLTMEGTGRQFNLGQDLRPGLADQTFTVSAYERQVDLTQPRARTRQTRTPNFAYFQGPQAQTQVQGVDGDVAYNVGANNTPVRASTAAALERRAERYHHPLVLLRAAIAPDAGVSGIRTEGAHRVIDIETPAGRVSMAIGADGRPAFIRSAGTHPNLGDVVLTTTFADYVEATGLRVPTRITTKVDDFTTGEYTVTNRVADTGTIEAPAAATSASVPAAPAVNVAVDEIAPGVWFLAGQSHHSVAVAFKDRLVLIEAPQSEARSLAVIARARQLVPGTPLTHLVLSHHHFDHSTGMRAAIAEGLAVIAQEGNAAFVTEMAARPFTRAPDALAKASKPVTVEPVADTHTITDGARSLVLYHVAGNPHSETMLMAYLPKERLLVEVDAFSPGGSYHPYAANLLENVQRRKLQVDRIVPLHGAVGPFADLVAAARPAS